MRLASISLDSWELRSAERSHRQHPHSFYLPALAERQNLRRGQAAKLIFDIEAEDEQKHVLRGGERMWVIVAERIGGTYVGILDSQPASIEPSEQAYLCFGAEIPFTAEHVIEIATPPEKYATWQLSQPPQKTWPRSDE